MNIKALDVSALHATLGPMLTVIIPTLNAAATLPTCLDSIKEGVDTVVVDGGSTDATRERATQAGATVVESTPGRGRQMALGAKTASQPWLFFIHSDTILPSDWSEKAFNFIHNANADRQAAYFSLGFDERSSGARRVATLANWRAKTFGLPYGDQGLLIHRDFYEEIGGYRADHNLMEDVDLVRRIGPMRLKRLNATITTSAAKYRADGWWARPLKNLLCLSLYLIGAPRAWYERLYG